jgi:hypothetical protein
MLNEYNDPQDCVLKGSFFKQRKQKGPPVR